MNLFLATACMFYLNHSYSSSTVRRVYLSHDRQRLGFEFYSPVATWGKRIECPIGYVTLEDTSKNRFSGSWYRLKIPEYKENSAILLAMDGLFK